MKTKAKKKPQKPTLTSVFDIITQIHKQTPATANQIIASVSAWAADRGLTAIVPVIYAIIEQESGFDPNVSGGLMQLTTKAEDQLQICCGYSAGYSGIDPNIHAGIYYLHSCLCGKSGKIADAVTAYNGGGDKSYLAHITEKLANYTTNTGLITSTIVVEGCISKWLKAANVDSVVVSPSSVNKGEKVLVTWTGKNPDSVDIFQIKVRFRLVGLAAEPIDQVISRIPANSTVTRSVQLTIGAQTKSGDHTIMATAQTASIKCGGARKSVKTVLTVKEQKKTVLLERKDGIQEHYHVCDNDSKYAGEFGIPTETTWA